MLERIRAIYGGDAQQRKRLKRLASVDDFRREARRVLPRLLFDYVDGAAGDERTASANAAEFHRHWLVPRTLQPADGRSQATTLLGQTLSSPVMVAPTGLSGMLYPGGEAAVARACARSGTGMVVSAAAVTALEDVAASGAEHLWFQQFIYRDRGFTRELMQRAAASGYGALCITVDVPVSPPRDRDVRNGFSVPLELSTSTIMDVMRRLRWLYRMRRHWNATLENFRSANEDGHGDVASLAQQMNRLIDPHLSWNDLAWVRSEWKGPLVVKGILHPGDAVRAMEVGADAIVVSNHGGRQLDGAIPSLRALPAVIEAVGPDYPVVLDGGVRRGSDVVTALGYGARAVMIGRTHLWGLAVAGEPGVERVLTLLKEELDVSMTLLGVQHPSEAEPHLDR